MQVHQIIFGETSIYQLAGKYALLVSTSEYLLQVYHVFTSGGQLQEMQKRAR